MAQEIVRISLGGICGTLWFVPCFYKKYPSIFRFDLIFPVKMSFLKCQVILNADAMCCHLFPAIFLVN